jgi:hypothetical protein
MRPARRRSSRFCLKESAGGGRTYCRTAVAAADVLGAQTGALPPHAAQHNLLVQQVEHEPVDEQSMPFEAAEVSTTESRSTSRDALLDVSSVVAAGEAVASTTVALTSGWTAKAADVRPTSSSISGPPAQADTSTDTT